MSEAKDDEDADGGEKEIYDFKLDIDRNLPPTGFPYCDYIECGYFVHAVAKTNRLYDDVVVKLPIIIQYGDKTDWEDIDALPKDPQEEDATVTGAGEVTDSDVVEEPSGEEDQNL